MNQNLMIWLWVFIFLITFILATIFYGAEDPDIYVEAYRPNIEQSNSRKATQRKRNASRSTRDSRRNSSEPSAPGLRESDIKKKRGNRYNTF